MARDVSIIISAQDNFSSAIQKMKAAQTSFRKDAGELQKELDILGKTRSVIKVDIVQAKKDLDAAKAAFKETADEASRLELETKQANYDNLTSSLRMISKEANRTEKDLHNLTATASKAENRASGGVSGMMSTLASAGATQMAGQLVSQAANTYVQSAVGSEMGTLFGSGLAGAGSGAAIGSMIAPGIGTAIGAGVGALVGTAQGALQNFQSRDDAFKSVYQERYNNAMNDQQDSLENGSVVASAREMTQMSFATLFKNEGVAKNYLADVQEFADYTPFQYEDLTGMSKTLKTFQYGIEELIPTMTIIGDTGAALGITIQDMNTVATALGRMRSSGKVSLEYINMLQERGIDAVGAISEGFGLDRAGVYDSITKGTLDAAGAVQAITDFMERDYTGSMEKQARSFSGLTSTVEGLNNSLDAAMGEGYNETRKDGLQAQIDWLDNSEMKNAYRSMGKWKASLENSSEEMQRDMMGAVMGGDLSGDYSEEVTARITELADQYKTAATSGTESAGAEMGRIIAEAQSLAQSEYEASEGFQLQKETNLKTVENIRNDTALKEEYWNTGYVMGQEFSKGLSSAIKIEPPSDEVKDIYRQHTGWSGTGVPRNLYVPPKAFGMNFVPYDNFPALLHQGERVLTASEARSADTSPQINITGTFTIREEADVDKIAAEIVRKIQLARKIM